MSLAFTPDRFTGSTVIVTGAGSGIGKATAIRLVLEGARVIATDVAADRLATLVSENPEADLVTVAGDVSTPAVIDQLVAAAGGTVFGLANVAGIMDAFLPPAEVDDATWDRVLSVNLTAPMRLIRAVLPQMIAAGKGAIVNVSSEASLRASASGVAYTSSEHAVNGPASPSRSSTKRRASPATPSPPAPWRPTSRRRSSRSTPRQSSARSWARRSRRWPPPTRRRH